MCRVRVVADGVVGDVEAALLEPGEEPGVVEPVGLLQGPLAAVAVEHQEVDVGRAAVVRKIRHRCHLHPAPRLGGRGGHRWTTVVEQPQDHRGGGHPHQDQGGDVEHHRQPGKRVGRPPHGDSAGDGDDPPERQQPVVPAPRLGERGSVDGPPHVPVGEDEHQEQRGQRRRLRPRPQHQAGDHQQQRGEAQRGEERRDHVAGPRHLVEVHRVQVEDRVDPEQPRVEEEAAHGDSEVREAGPFQPGRPVSRRSRRR